MITAADSRVAEKYIDIANVLSASMLAIIIIIAILIVDPPNNNVLQYIKYISNTLHIYSILI